MIIGTRVLRPEDVGLWNEEIIQISVYSGLNNNISRVALCARMCKKLGIRYVVHPVGYFVLDKEAYDSLLAFAKWADLALILHDEKAPDGARIAGQYEAQFKESLDELSSVAHLSFENATDTRDARWFWNKFSLSITLDIGHIESAGLDSAEYVRSLSPEEISKIDYVHIHRNNGWRDGLTDHWPLSPGCRELMALKELIRLKPDVNVILEINETQRTGESLDLLRSLRAEFIRLA
ncbi:MAG: hypothetical protein AB1390_05575 [Nitrospirota bacterium]